MIKKELNPKLKFVLIFGFLLVFGLFVRWFNHYTADDLYKSSDGCLYTYDPDSYYFLFGDDLNARIVQKSERWFNYLSPNSTTYCLGTMYVWFVFIITLLLLCYLLFKLNYNYVLGGLFFVLNYRIFFITTTGFFDRDLLMLPLNVLLVYFVLKNNKVGVLGIMGFLYFFWNGFWAYAVCLGLYYFFKYIKYYYLSIPIITTLFLLIPRKPLIEFQIQAAQTIIENQSTSFLNSGVLSPLIIIPLFVLVTSKIKNNYPFFQYCFGMTASLFMPKLINISLIPLFFLISQNKFKKTLIFLLILEIILVGGYKWQYIERTFEVNDHLENITQHINSNKLLINKWYYGHYFRSKGLNITQSGELSAVGKGQSLERVNNCEDVEIFHIKKLDTPNYICYNTKYENTYYKIYKLNDIS